MLLALLLNDPRLKGKAIYRSLLILPYALPTFITALVWKSMYNQDFGLINSYTGLNVDWLGNPWAAKAAILLTNLWLGFPYMFIVCTGALQSIPGDVREAARIDGANAFRMLRSIIMPLLLVAVGPLLIASFAFNFNNFTLIFLLTGGGPFDAGNTSIGSSDLLITYAYRLAFSGTTPNYGFAAAVSIFIFIIVAVAELLRVPPDQVPGRGELMSEVYQRESVAIPHERGRGCRCTPPPAVPPRRRPGSGTWWRHGLAVVALIWSLFPIVFIVSAALNPAGSLETSQLLPTSASLANFGTLFTDGARPYVSWYRNSLLIAGVGVAVLGLHRRLCGVRLLPAAVRRPPAGAAGPAAAADVPRAARVRGALRHVRRGRRRHPRARPEQPLGPDPRLPRRGDGRQRVAAQGLLRHGAARAGRGGQGRRCLATPGSSSP